MNEVLATIGVRQPVADNNAGAWDQLTKLVNDKLDGYVKKNETYVIKVKGIFEKIKLIQDKLNASGELSIKAKDIQKQLDACMTEKATLNTQLTSQKSIFEKTIGDKDIELGKLTTSNTEQKLDSDKLQSEIVIFKTEKTKHEEKVASLNEKIKNKDKEIQEKIGSLIRIITEKDKGLSISNTELANQLSKLYVEIAKLTDSYSEVTSKSSTPVTTPSSTPSIISRTSSGSTDSSGSSWSSANPNPKPFRGGKRRTKRAGRRGKKTMNKSRRRRRN